MFKIFVVVLSLLVPTFAQALQTNYPVISAIEVMGCGDDTEVIISGTSTYENMQQCTRVYSQIEGQSFFTLRAQDCNSPTSWAFSIPFDEGTYRFKARVDTAEGFNKAETTSIYFTVPPCTCP